MGLFYNNSVADCVGILIALITVIFTYYKWAFKYWKNKNVPYLEPAIPLGNSKAVLPVGSAIGARSKDYYDEMKKKNFKFGGVYFITKPVFVLIDPSYVRDILVKDFHYFTDRAMYHNEKNDPIGAHLFTVDGPKWKFLRVKLTPTFTSGKMKLMFNSILECSDYMKDALGIMAESNEDLDIKDVMARFTTDVIGICAYGINCNSFKDTHAEFRQLGVKMFEPKLLYSIRSFFHLNMPKLCLALGVRSTRHWSREFIYKVVKETVAYRENTEVKQNDFLQLLIDIKNNKSIANENEKKPSEFALAGDSQFTIDDIAAQVLLFFIAGFDTSSSTLSFALYQIAKNNEIQQKIRNEINEVLSKFDGKLSYESLSEMKYIGQVIDETLRFYPPVPTLNRDCVKDYKLRDTEIVIEKGTSVLIPVLGFQMDSEYWPEPNKFDPDRFSEKNKHNLHPFTHLPFGVGPRNCIGTRFGIMQTKIGIISTVKNFKLSVSAKTKEPVEINPDTFLITSVSPIYLNIEKIENKS